MKILLACLMCLVLGETQAWAIDGGPNYGGQVTVTGTYAGTLAPIPIVLSPGPPKVTTTDNSLALFTISIPTSGLATGTMAVFRNGIFYTDTIQGTADPDSAKLTGIFNTTGTVGTVLTGVTYLAYGEFQHTSMVANTNTSSTAAVRIHGQAILTYVNDGGDPNGDSGGAISYRVRGFKQTNVTG